MFAQITIPKAEPTGTYSALTHSDFGITMEVGFAQIEQPKVFVAVNNSAIPEPASFMLWMFVVFALLIAYKYRKR